MSQQLILQFPPKQHDPSDRIYKQQSQRARLAGRARVAKNKSPDFVAERFWHFVDKRGVDECWPWKGCLNYWGYGQFQFQGNSVIASRFMFVMLNGPIDESIYVCHRCDNRACCNPNHLFPDTAKGNAQDCINKGRWSFKKGEKHGMHKLTDAKVRQARKLHALGLVLMRMAKCFSYAALARRYGVTDVAIQEAVTRNTWKHVT